MTAGQDHVRDRAVRGVHHPDVRGRRTRGADTRRLLLATAERLYAQHGVAEVSNRQVAEAAGQANNSVVAYHVGTKIDLVLAVVRAHNEPMDRIRAGLVDAAAGSPDLRDHLACLVLPLTRHLAELGVPSWYARFAAQLDTDPGLRALVMAETMAGPVMRRAFDGVRAHFPDQPAHVKTLRGEMARHAVLHTCAEHERALAEGATPTHGWEELGQLVLDALVGLYTAPIRQ
jgi:AcrR family transcriptional regulator